MFSCSSMLAIKTSHFCRPFPARPKQQSLNLSANATMPRPECRESREVQRDNGGNAWRAVAAGVITSNDVDERGRVRLLQVQRPSSTAQSQQSASPPTPTPFQRQTRPQIPIPLYQQRPSQLSVVSASPQPTQPTQSAPPPPSSTSRTPLERLDDATLNALITTMGEEIRALEAANGALRKKLHVQDQLIVGFCELRVQGVTKGVTTRESPSHNGQPRR